jgi:DNA processing protein
VDPSADRNAWLALASVAGVGPRTCGALVRAFGSPAGVLRAPRAHLAHVPGVGPVRGAALVHGLAAADPARLLAEAARAGLTILTPVDQGYPTPLQADPDPPPALWVRGTLPDLGATPAVAIVGTRAATRYGERTARTLAEALARRGVVVVSGLARGIDAAAHAGCLAGGGTTLAVLGCGADVVYPPEHTALTSEVAHRGALLSEHPPGTPPHPGHFPRRNRIVACLAAVTVVAEAPLRSGALVTARLALEAGREVLAVPGPVDTGTHAGCHRLLRDGARLCEGVGDVLAALGQADVEPLLGGPAPARPTPSRAPPAGPALVLFEAVDPDEPRDLDDLARRTGLSADAVASGITLLELDGWIVRVPGVGVRRTDG